MTQESDRFRQHCVAGIRRFVQTAIVIDNEAYLTTNEEPGHSERPRRARTLPASVLDPRPTATDEPGNGEAAETTAIPATDATPSRSPHTLNAKLLADAFHNLEIVCGVYRPDSGDAPVSLATKAAQHADIVIIDWFLDSSKTGSKAKDIVKSILRRDSLEHGRLRLITIYTGEGDLTALADDLLAEMNKDEEILSGGIFRRNKSGSALVRPDSKICFFNKPATLGGAPANLMTVSDLPERLVYEFSEVTEGLLANFAVSAIAAIRRSAHHVAALFRKELDGAYLAHRSRLDQPDDATAFAIELVTDEIGSVISMAGVADECLSTRVIDAWVDHVAANNAHEFKEKGGRKYSLEDIKRLLLRGLKAVNDALGLSSKSVEGVFFESPQEAWKHSFDFARLASLKHEPRDRSRFPVDWAPMLTLGTVLKIVRPIGQEGKAAGDPLSDYFVCVQPLCHSLRLDRKTVLPDGTVGFPFQTATIATQTDPEFNLAIRDERANNVDLLVGWKPRDGAIFRFQPDATRQIVRATPDASSGNYFFTDGDGRTFLWLGDIKTGAAQRSASEIAKYLHTPGTNEFEWLREAAKKKIDYEGKVVVALPTAGSVPPAVE